MPKRFSLVALASGLSLAKPKSENDLPDRLLVCPWGETETRKGKVICNETTVATLPQMQAANKFDRVAFDFQHNTVKGGAEPIKVAGYGTPEVVEGEGIYLSAIEYTEDGKAALPAGHYPDISPAIMRNGKGEVIFLHSVGACRQGEIDGLTLFSASDMPTLDTFEPMMPEGETDTAADDLRALLRDLIAAIAPEVELAETASDADLAAGVKQAITAMGAKKPAPAADPAKKEDPEAGPDLTAMAARIDAFEARFDARERKGLVDLATRQGKVIPLSAEAIAKIDLAVFESMIEALPVTVPMESRITGAVDDFRATPGAGGITPELREVARQLGRKPEDLLPKK